MSTTRVWLFRVLVLLAIGLLVFSWFQPWWLAHCVADVTGAHDVTVHPYGLDGGGLEGYFELMPEGGTEVAMPGWFAPLMWIYLGLVIAAVLIGIIFLRKNVTLFGRELNLSRWLIGIAGFSYLLVAVLAITVAYIRVGAMDLPFIGNEWVNLGHFGMWTIELDVTASIPFGYWLAVAAGPLLMLLAIFRNKLIGSRP